MRRGDPLEERRRGVVRLDVDDGLADDRAGVRGRVDDLEQRDAGARETGEDRPRDRCAAAVTREQRRVHAEDALTRERDERLADELVPADDEDELGLELAERVQRRVRVEVVRLEVLRSEPRGDVVEAAACGAVDGGALRQA